MYGKFRKLFVANYNANQSAIVETTAYLVCTEKIVGLFYVKRKSIVEKWGTTCTYITCNNGKIRNYLSYIHCVNKTLQVPRPFRKLNVCLSHLCA